LTVIIDIIRRLVYFPVTHHMQYLSLACLLRNLKQINFLSRQKYRTI